MNQTEIEIPDIEIPTPWEKIPKWRINAPWLKLSLKYGIDLGPWLEHNRSAAFDRYSMSRGPVAGPPTVSDLAITTMMNSNVKGSDLARVSDWLSVSGNFAVLRETAENLAKTNGLHEIAEPDLNRLASVLERLRSEFDGIRTAKVAKWFAAWAPAHIPMIDRYVGEALVGPSRKPSSVSWVELLNSYKSLVAQYLKVLLPLAQRLGAALGTSAIPPGRVMDGLIWFDWCGCYRKGGFRKWVSPDDKAGIHAVTQAGLDYERGGSAQA